MRKKSLPRCGRVSDTVRADEQFSGRTCWCASRRRTTRERAQICIVAGITQGRDGVSTVAVYQAIEDLGIAVLPCIVEMLKEGKHDFIDMAVKLTDNKPPVRGEPPSTLPVAEELKAERFLRWWEQNKQDWLIPWPEEE